MKRILLIDDEAPLRKLVCAALKSTFEIEEAENGQDGFQSALSRPPHLVICDVNMQQLNGFDTLSRMRENPLTRATPFIFLTGVTTPNAVRRGMDLGADDYLSKPFHPQTLRAAVHARLVKHEQMQADMNAKVRRLQQSIATTLPNELLGPTDNLLALTELIGKGYREFDREEIIAMSRDAHKAAVRVRHQIENCLLYAELLLLAQEPERAAVRSKPMLTCVSDLAEVTATEYARQCGRAGDIKFCTSYCEALVVPDDFRKIVQELLDNALKATPARKPVTVTIRPVDARAVVEIYNAGPGMTAEQIAAPEAFVRIEKKMALGKGSGLGLTIAKRLTELGGGTFQIESGHGTTIRLTFRRARHGSNQTELFMGAETGDIAGRPAPPS